MIEVKIEKYQQQKKKILKIHNVTDVKFSEIVRFVNQSFFLLFLLFAHYYFFSSIFRWSFLSFNVRPWSALLDAEYLLIIN